MFTFEEFQKMNRSHWSNDEMQRNYAIALQVEKNYYEKFGTAKEPKIGDIVEYTDGWHVYKYASIVENVYYEDENTRVCICDNGSSHTSTGRGFTTSGGAFHGKDKSQLQYVGEDKNIVWTWGCHGAGADQGIYLPLTVNRWIIPYDPKSVKRSMVWSRKHNEDNTYSVCIQNSDDCMCYAHSFKSRESFEAWAKYVGYQYQIEEDGERAYSYQEVCRRCWVSEEKKPKNGKPIKVVGNGKVHDGLVVTEELRITEYWPNIYTKDPAYGTPEYQEQLEAFWKYHNNPMGV